MSGQEGVGILVRIREVRCCRRDEVLWADGRGPGHVWAGRGGVLVQEPRWRAEAAVPPNGRAPAAQLENGKAPAAPPDGGGAKQGVGGPGTTWIVATPGEMLLRVQAGHTSNFPRERVAGGETGKGGKRVTCLRVAAEGHYGMLVERGMGGRPTRDGVGCDTRHGIAGACSGSAGTGRPSRDQVRKNPSALCWRP